MRFEIKRKMLSAVRLIARHVALCYWIPMIGLTQAVHHELTLSSSNELNSNSNEVAGSERLFSSHKFISHENRLSSNVPGVSHERRIKFRLVRFHNMWHSFWIIPPMSTSKRVTKVQSTWKIFLLLNAWESFLGLFGFSLMPHTWFISMNESNQTSTIWIYNFP